VRLPVRPVKGQMLLTKLPPGALPHMILHKDQYLVPRVDGHLLIGSTMEEAGFDTGVTAEAVSLLRKRAAEMLPALADAPILGSWAGLRPATPDRMPYLGPVPGFDGLLVATGHFRNGILLGPLTGRLIAEAIHAASNHALEPFRLNRRNPV
jgi:glycine oxidase